MVVKEKEKGSRKTKRNSNQEKEKGQGAKIKAETAKAYCIGTFRDSNKNYNINFCQNFAYFLKHLTS